MAPFAIEPLKTPSLPMVALLMAVPPHDPLIVTDGVTVGVPVEEMVDDDAFVKLVPVLDIVPLMAVFAGDTFVELALDAAPVLEIVPLIAVFVDDALVVLAPLVDTLEEDVLVLVSVVPEFKYAKDEAEAGLAMVRVQVPKSPPEYGPVQVPLYSASRLFPKCACALVVVTRLALR